MKKTTLITLLTASLASLFVVACGSGSSNDSGSTPPATNVTPAPIPAGFTPAGTKPAPIAINDDATSIAVPVNGTFQPLTIPADVTAAILAAGTANITTASDGANILLTVPASEATGGKQVTYVLTPNTTTQSVAPQVTTDLTAVSYDTTGAVTNVVAVPATGATPAGVYFATSSAIVIQPPMSDTSTPAYTTPISTCNATGTSTAVQFANYSGQGYFGLGTSTGSVCVLNGTTSPSSVVFTNLSSQAPASRYIPGSVISFSFSVTGGILYGYWFENVNGTPTVYRVTANSSIVAQSFWNVTTSAAQTNSSGTTLTFGNVPASVNSMYSDSSNNLYLGTNSGSVYKLANGFTTYSSAQLTAATGSVFLAPTNTLAGTTASTLIGGALNAFSIN